VTTVHSRALSFEAPDAAVDASLNVYVPPPGSEQQTSFTVAREPRAGALAEQERRALERLSAMLPSFRVLARRPRRVGTLAAREVRATCVTSARSLYQRIAFVAYYDIVLVLTATAPAAQQVDCDRLAEAWLASFQFRKQAA
jgi:hypothetical protein